MVLVVFVQCDDVAPCHARARRFEVDSYQQPVIMRVEVDTCA